MNTAKATETAERDPMPPAGTLSHAQTLPPIVGSQARLTSALQDRGYLLLADPLPGDLSPQMFQYMHQFFSMSDSHSVKRATLAKANPHEYGWTPAFGEPAYVPGTVASVESLDFSPAYPEKNRWPEIAGFRSCLHEFSEAMFTVAQRILMEIAVAVGLPHTFFAGQCQSQALNTMRLLHYPQNRLPDNDTHVGIAAHTDFECLTLILQSEPGLEVRTPGGDWVEVPHGNRAVTVLLGDMLERWTNGQLRATPHRVDNQRHGRQSIVLFVAVDAGVEVQPLAQFVPTGQAPRFGAVNQETHLKNAVQHATDNISSYQKELQIGVQAGADRS